MTKKNRTISDDPFSVFEAMLKEAGIDLDIGDDDIGGADNSGAGGEDDMSNSFDEWVNTAPLSEVLEYVFPEEFNSARERWEEENSGKEEEQEPEEEPEEGVNPDE